MKDKINLIFDCDGTLVDSYDAITDHVLRTFAAFGVSCDPEDVRKRCLYRTVGHCREEIAAEYGLDPEEVAREYGSSSDNVELIRLYPGTAALLKDEHFRSFVYTHRGKSVYDIFARLGIIDFFEEIVDFGFGFKAKPDSQGVDYLVQKYGLDKAKTYYVGDRIIDIRCGLNAGVGTIFYNSSGLDINSSEADFVVSDLTEIIDLADKL